VDLLPKRPFGPIKRLSNDITITLEHPGAGNGAKWCLTTTTATRMLYSLVHRATQGRYSSFTIRLASTKATITDSAFLILGVTDLVRGGTIELSRTDAHVRSAYEVHVKHIMGNLVLLVPREGSILSVMSYINASHDDDISDMELW
jgi:hypothetical protein